MKKMNWLEWSAMVLVILGALNWGLVGLFDFNLVTWFFGDIKMIIPIVYDLIGLAAFYVVYMVLTKE